jgi:GNAT superfamily N-acetyltransferase
MNDRLVADPTLALLDNIVWNSLTSDHAKFAAGTMNVRRYARGFSPLIGAREVDAPDLVALEPCCTPGEQFYYAGWGGPPAPGWRVDVDSTMEQYVWDAAPPRDERLDAIRLGTAHAGAALELVRLTHPGPFAARTPELGEYYGLFDGDRLIAMAGERMHAGPLREISGVCTHPDHQGRGLARKLMNKVVRLQLARGQRPFLHVMSANAGARRLYETMGFRHHQQLAVRVITFVGPMARVT